VNHLVYFLTQGKSGLSGRGPFARMVTDLVTTSEEFGVGIGVAPADVK
jgi:hypothetical protein